jgi:hypothetical protein
MGDFILILIDTIIMFTFFTMAYRLYDIKEDVKVIKKIMKKDVINKTEVAG